ncbi:Cryptic sugar kinase Mak [hydrothermal vent metagenome]|uniref:Cryptic sugar kinase Mak n=1 Tax=hydrothermal vent metagenome TaxID=652676 RepID=A0A3B0YDF9_9ZZZZ
MVKIVFIFIFIFIFIFVFIFYISVDEIHDFGWLTMRIGIDLGGTKIECIVLDDAGVMFCQRTNTPQGDYRGTLEAIVQLVNSAEQKFDQWMTVGIGTPGAISPTTGLLRNSNSVCLNNNPLLQDLEQALNREVRLANDADCFALSEAVDGAGADLKTVFGAIVGTGVGAGIVINQRLLSGPNAIAGEWGHNPVPWLDQVKTSRDCYCGKQDCVESYLSGSGLEKNYWHLSGQVLHSPDIVTLALKQDVLAEQALVEYEDNMAKSLAQIINILDPDVIVLGGGMSNIDRLYVNVPNQWAQYVFSDQVSTVLCRAKYGDSSGVRGAAWLWPAIH